MLKLSKRADYGLIALRHLAVQENNGSASAKQIAEFYGMPVPLLSKILQQLARGGFVVSVQGARGGYRLAKNAGEISALDVIRTIDGPTILTACFTAGERCEQAPRCTVREPLRRVREGIVSLLDGITIEDMAGREGGRPDLGPGERIYPADSQLATTSQP